MCKIYKMFDKKQSCWFYHFDCFPDNLKKDKLIPHPSRQDWYGITTDYQVEFSLTFSDNISNDLGTLIALRLAEQIIGGQPMSDPVGQIHTLRARYEEKIDSSDLDESL